MRIYIMIPHLPWLEPSFQNGAKTFHFTALYIVHDTYTRIYIYDIVSTLNGAIFQNRGQELSFDLSIVGSDRDVDRVSPRQIALYQLHGCGDRRGSSSHCRFTPIVAAPVSVCTSGRRSDS